MNSDAPRVTSDRGTRRAPSLMSRLGIHVESVAESQVIGSVDLRREHRVGHAVMAGHIATLVDVTGGVCAAENAAAPVVTADLGLGLLEPVTESTIRAVATPLRVGRRAVVVEVCLRREADGATVGLATMTSSRLPVPEDRAHRQASVGERLRKSRRGPRWPQRADSSETDFADRLGIRDLEPSTSDAAGCEVSLRPELSNGAGTLHGGMGTLMADHAARRAATPYLSHPWCWQLDAHYLAPGRTGPFRARGRIVGVSRLGVLARIDVTDTGQDDRLILATTARLRASDS